ncbi:MAG TPA: hypothetical protein VFH36_10100 [Acidimicrobiales bacterium]|nr:hypothetical protein [Acidimicrobiales bacterium]
MLAPDLARDRLVLANELIGVASESGHEFLALMGLCWRAVDLFLLGDGRAGRALEDLRERADALMSQNILYIIEVLDVMRLIRAGRLDEAVAAAERCYELGIEVGEIDLPVSEPLGGPPANGNDLRQRYPELLEAC